MGNGNRGRDPRATPPPAEHAWTPGILLLVTSELPTQRWFGSIGWISATATGVAGGLVTWTFHAGLDWDWEMPAVTLPALLLAASSIACTDQKREAGRGLHAYAVDLQTRPSAAAR